MGFVCLRCWLSRFCLLCLRVCLCQRLTAVSVGVALTWEMLCLTFIVLFLYLCYAGVLLRYFWLFWLLFGARLDFLDLVVVFVFWVRLGG